MRPKTCAADPSTSMDGLVGNVSAVEMPHPDIERMLQGSFGLHMPLPLAVLSECISVAWIVPTGSPSPDLRGVLGVRRQHVSDALQWLKTHNPLYHDIVIDPARLAQLPEFDLPEEVIVRQSSNPDLIALADREGSSNWTAPSYDDASPVTSVPCDPDFGCFSDVLSHTSASTPPSIEYDLDGCFADLPITSFEHGVESPYLDSGCFDDLDLHPQPSTLHDPFSNEELSRTSTCDPLLVGKLYFKHLNWSPTVF